MSEEILKALMQLFAIITRQDGRLSDKEKNYVHSFLVRQIGVESSAGYYRLFLDTAERKDGSGAREIRRITRYVSIRDNYYFYAENRSGPGLRQIL